MNCLQASRFFTFLARFPIAVHWMEGTVVLTEPPAAVMTIALVRIVLVPVLHRLHPNPLRLLHPHPLPSREARKVLQPPSIDRCIIVVTMMYLYKSIFVPQ
jgi:hypothetical protein